MSALNSVASSEISVPSSRNGVLVEPPKIFRVLLLTALFSAAAVYEAAHLWSLSTAEIWAHLRTGTWIWQNAAIPHTGLFSQYPNMKWNDSTWAFDALLGVGYRLLGLRAIPVVLVMLKVAFAVATYLLARARRANVWTAVALSSIAQFVIWNLQPLPYVFSICFLACEIHLLLESRRTGSTRGLFWLPLMFAVWANVHVQFVAGLVLLGLFLVSLLVEHGLRRIGVGWLSSRILPVALKQAGVVTALSAVATLATPYTFHLLPGAFTALYSDVAFEHLTELSAMSFRRPQEYALMLLVMMAFLVLGRRRSLELFELLMLCAGTAVAFRIQRDTWMVVLPAVAVLAEGFLSQSEKATRERVFTRDGAAVAGLTALVFLIAALRLPPEEALMYRVSQNFPVKACDAIVANRLAPPLFNAYSWGSFLMWYLPQYPVAIDSRSELYGDEILAKYFDVVGGKGRLEDAPAFVQSRTLLLERNSAIAKALTNLPALRGRYRLVYSDEIASVFVPTSSEQ